MDGAARVLRRGRGYAPAPIDAAGRLCRCARPPRLRRRAESNVLPSHGRQSRSCRSISAISRTPRHSTTTAAASSTSRRFIRPRAGRDRGRSPSRLSLVASLLARGRAMPDCRSSKSSIITPMSPPALPKTDARSMRRRCWASCSTGSAGATTARSGAANSCWPIIGRHVGSATFKPVAMPGGDAAAREPWRNLYAHLMAEMGWAELAMNFADSTLHRDLAAKPRATLDAMIRAGTNAPKASSCGRLFDAVAAALGLCRERQGHEGEAASRLEALVSDETLREEDEALAYPFTIPNLPDTGLPYIEPLAMWRAILGDLDPRHASAGHGRALPQGLGQSDRRDGAESSRASTKTNRRASTPSRCRAAVFRTRCCSRTRRVASRRGLHRAGARARAAERRRPCARPGGDRRRAGSAGGAG